MLPGKLTDPFARSEHEPVKSVYVASTPVAADLVVETRPGIAGVVRDEEDDTVAGARVFVAAEKDGLVVSPRGRPSLTDDEGRFSFEDLLPGTYRVVAYRPGGGNAEREGVEAGTTNAELVFPRLGRISGVVRNPDGEPATAFNVFAAAEGSKDKRFIPMGDPGGVFSIGGLAPASYRIDFETPTGKTTLNVTLEDGETKSGLEVELEARTRIVGRLVDEEGNPRDGWDLALVVAGAPRVMDNVRITGQTRSDGTFELYDVAVESLALIAGPDPSPAAFAMAKELASITPKPGEVNDLGDVVAGTP